MNPGVAGHTGVGSLPSRGAWIEMGELTLETGELLSLPSRGAWIEILLSVCAGPDRLGSLPSRGAWIEIK